MNPALFWTPRTSRTGRAGASTGGVRLPWWAWLGMVVFGALLGIGLVSMLDSEDGDPGPDPVHPKKKRGPRRLVLSASSSASRNIKITVRPAASTGPAGEAEPLPGGLLLRVRVIEARARTPIESALVNIRPPGGEDFTLITDGSGEGDVEIPVWPLKSLSISAEAFGYLTSAAREVALPEKAHRAEVTIELQPPMVVRGYVRAAGSNQPLIGAEIDLKSTDPGPAESGWEMATTDLQGHYEVHLETLPAQGLILTARARGYLPQVKENSGSRGEVRQDFDLEPEAAVRGLVVDARTRRPVSGANVCLVSSRAEFADMGGNAVTDEDGTFELDVIGIPRASAWVLVQADDHSPAAVSLPERAGEIVVQLGPVVTLRGQVRVPGEFGFHEDFTVTASARDLYGNALSQDTAEADVEGTYELELRNVPPDHADILVESSTGAIRGFKPTPFSGASADIAQGTLDIPVTLPFKMTGTLTGAQDGSPIPRALVRVSSRDPRYPDFSSFTTTDQDGRYSLEIQGIPRDSLEVWVEDGEMQYQAGGLAVPDDAETWTEDLTIDRE